MHDREITWDNAVIGPGSAVDWQKAIQDSSSSYDFAFGLY